MSQFELCLLDCQSIQKYVFGSNKLKTNIGASENVAKIFEKGFLKKALNTANSRLNWEEHSQELEILKPDSKLDVEVGYIGGGNALLIFRNGGSISAADFVRNWSKRVLLQFPGIVPAAAISDYKPTDTPVDANDLNLLFRKLSITKNQMVPITELPRHGITTDCTQTGLSAEIFNSDENVQKWVSSVSKAKSDSAATAKMTDREKEILESDPNKPYQFTGSEENLGQTEAHNHIAIVHIDGNSMGKQFQTCKDLSDRRKLSLAVEKKTRDAWEYMLRKLKEKITNLEKNTVIKPHIANNKKYDFPVRKLILNGDDLTFVCNAQLAFWLTEKFLEKLTQSALTFKNIEMMDREDKPIYMSACAGIAIVKTKFPFYRAYELAEDLCANAKKIGRDKKESWLDFEIVYGGVAGPLASLREKKYPGGVETLGRPWRLFDASGKDEALNTDWNRLKKVLDELRDEKDGLPRSKQKTLLHMITRGKQSFQDYEIILQASGTKLPNLPVDGEKTKIQFLYDALQVIEFYPDCLLEEGDNHA